MTNVVFPAAELLAPEEEIELARRMEAGTLAAAVLTGEREFSAATVAELTALAREGRAARERYVEANLRLVAMVAYPAARRAGLSFTELFQEGAGGLLLAVDRFDHTQRVRFATYALPWIRAQVSRAVGNRCGALPLSGFRADRRRAAQGAALVVSQRLGREATIGEIAAELGQTEDGLAELLAVRPPVALVDDAGMVFDPPDPRAVRALEAVCASPPAVTEWVRRLPAPERRVVTLRFGFDSEPASYSRVADTLGLSKSTVRRIEKRALDRLREWCSTEHLPLAG